MEGLASLLTAVAGLVTALGGAVALVVTAVRTSRRERPRAVANFAAELAEAARDGEITADELRAIAGEKPSEGGES